MCIASSSPSCSPFGLVDNRDFQPFLGAQFQPGFHHKWLYKAQPSDEFVVERLFLEERMKALFQRLEDPSPLEYYETNDALLAELQKDITHLERK